MAKVEYDGIMVRRRDENVCTCGAHPNGDCECDSPYCGGGTPYVGDDGSLWVLLPERLEV